MNKLIKLLNQYLKFECPTTQWEFNKDSYQKINNVFVDKHGWSEAEETIISKRYGFIKWLVDNDKLKPDSNKPYQRHIIDSVLESEVYKVYISWLTLSDTPIEDLISYLK